MKQINTIQFVDIDSGDEALIIIRASPDYVALCLSKMEDMGPGHPAPIYDPLMVHSTSALPGINTVSTEFENIHLAKGLI